MRIRGDVEAVGDIDPVSFAARFEALDRPVVIRGGARSLPAFGRWSVPYLRSAIGHVGVRYKLSQSGKHPDFDRPTLAETFARGESTFDEFLTHVTGAPREERAQRLFTGDEKFLVRRRDGATTVDPELAPLWSDTGLPALVPAERLYTVWAWFSGPGVRTWLHYDNNGCHNLNAQISGGKDCLLFEPAELERLYAFEPGGANPASNCFGVDVDAPDAARFPRFAEARALTASLVAGDLLFIPAWWPHAFFHFGEFNANVNYWWKPDAPRDNAISRRQASLDAHG